MTNAREIWKHLEKHFALTNGSRKYKISKDLYEIKQNSSSVNEYYTSMRTLWEELDAMNMLPVVSKPSEEVQKVLDTIEIQKEEARLFQFLNGIDDVYGPLRSHMLMLNPLPSVEMASATLQQEEAQRELLQNSAVNPDVMAMYSRNTENRGATCSACKVKGHTNDICWTVIGYPKWHPKNPSFNPSFTPNNNNRFNRPNNAPGWSSNTRQLPPKTAATAHTSGILFTPQQLEQLAQLMPRLQPQQNSNSSKAEDFDFHFSGMLSCHSSYTSTQ